MKTKRIPTVVADTGPVWDRLGFLKCITPMVRSWSKHSREMMGETKRE
jgi:hypothetical protein